EMPLNGGPPSWARTARRRRRSMQRLPAMPATLPALWAMASLGCFPRPLGRLFLQAVPESPGHGVLPPCGGWRSGRGAADAELHGGGAGRSLTEREGDGGRGTAEHRLVAPPRDI
ncbi:unnamed protein product, partial [Prorocentrum cordatum]